MIALAKASDPLLLGSKRIFVCEGILVSRYLDEDEAGGRQHTSYLAHRSMIIWHVFQHMHAESDIH